MCIIYTCTHICKTLGDHTYDALLCGVCEGQIYLQLVLVNGVVRAYVTPEHFTVPRNEWVLLALTCASASLKVVYSVVCYLYAAAAICFEKWGDGVFRQGSQFFVNAFM